MWVESQFKDKSVPPLIKWCVKTYEANIVLIKAFSRSFDQIANTHVVKTRADWEDSAIRFRHDVNTYGFMAIELEEDDIPEVSARAASGRTGLQQPGVKFVIAATLKGRTVFLDVSCLKRGTRASTLVDCLRTTASRVSGLVRGFRDFGESRL